jgi:hypothetical protein
MNIDKALAETGKIDALLYSIEGAMLDAAAETGMTETVERLHNLIYVLMDEFQALTAAIEAAQGDERVCNVILASEHVRKMEAELERLKKA